jgi:uncharacterized protein YdeI (YjbR/CyaY-like superfamily)
MEFTGEAQIKKAVLKSYVRQAIEVAKAGLSVDFKAKRELELLEELTQILKKACSLAKAVQALTPGRQRGHVLYFSSARCRKLASRGLRRVSPRSWLALARKRIRS